MPCVTITGTECETETGDRSGRVAPSGGRGRAAARVAEAASAESAATAVSEGNAASAATAATADGAGPFGPGFGPMGPGGPGGGFAGMFDRQAMFDRHAFGRGPRARKGDVRAAILDLLDEGGQWNGYQLIQEIAGRTSGVWRPSAGSVYPALQQLEDEGLIAPEGEGRRRMYALTDAGRAYAEEHADELQRLVGRRRRDDRRRGDRARRPGPPGHDRGDGGAPGRFARAAHPGPRGARADPPLDVPDPGRGRPHRDVRRHHGRRHRRRVRRRTGTAGA